MEFSSLVELANYEKETFLKECDLCGRCVEACQILPHLDIPTKDPVAFQEELIDFLKGNPPSPSVRERTFSCILCASCLRSCPRGLNLYFVEFMVKAEMNARGFKPAGAELPAASGQSGYDRKEVICSLQIDPEDMRWLKQAPENPEQADMVLFLGCSPYQQTDNVLAGLDILERLGLKYTAFRGGQDCCGFMHMAAGDWNKANDSCGKLIASLKSFNPKKVVFWCGTCYYMFKDEVPKFASLPFEVQHFSQLLGDNLSKFQFVPSREKTVTVHDSCNLGRKAGDYTSTRRLLGSIPGVKMVEMTHNKEKSICCGAAAMGRHPEIATRFRKQRMEEAKNAGADVMAASCSGCHLMYCLEEEAFGVEVRNYVNVLAEALGIRYEDKLKKYVRVGDIDKVIEDGREHLEKHGLSVEKAKGCLATYFNGLWANKSRGQRECRK